MNFSEAQLMSSLWMLVVEQVCVGMSADQVRGRDDAVAALLSIEDSGGGRGLRRRQMRRLRLRLLLLMLELLLLVVLVVVTVVVLGGCDAACDRLIQLFHFRALPPKPKQSLPLAQTQGKAAVAACSPSAVYQISSRASVGRRTRGRDAADNQIFV